MNWKERQTELRLRDQFLKKVPERSFAHRRIKRIALLSQGILWGAIKAKGQGRLGKMHTDLGLRSADPSTAPEAISRRGVTKFPR